MNPQAKIKKRIVSIFMQYYVNSNLHVLWIIISILDIYRWMNMDTNNLK